MGWLSKLFSDNKSQTPDEPQQLLLSAADYCEQGKKSLDAGKYVEAMEFFQAAIEADNRFEKAYLLLATAYEKQGNKDKARAALYGLLAVDPNNAEALRQIEMLNEKCQNTQINKSEPSVSIAPTAGAADNKVSQSQQSADGDKYSARNIGCALFGAIICIPCGIILFSEDKFWGGLSFVIIALLCITGPFINPDFWE